MNDLSSFNQKLLFGTRNVMDSSKDVFQSHRQPNQPSPAVQFALSLDHLIDSAPDYTPVIDGSITASTENVRQFIKDASKYFGQISINLESA